MPTPTDIQERIREIESVAPVEGLQDLSNDRVQRVPQRWSDPVRAGVSYFRVPDRRMPRGRITLLENGQNATERVMYREYQILQRYGGYRGANHPGDWQRTDVYLAIVMQGGLHEFDPEQILEMTWHVRPNNDSSRSHRVIWEKIDALIASGLSEQQAIVAVFPQLDGRDLTPAFCEACPGRLFKDAEAVRGHRSVMHKEDVQTMGTRDAIAQALVTGGNGAGLDRLADAMTAMLDQNRQLMEMLAAQNGAQRRSRPPKAPSDGVEEE
jgi:hypothetical protein